VTWCDSAAIKKLLVKRRPAKAPSKCYLIVSGIHAAGIAKCIRLVPCDHKFKYSMFRLSIAMSSGVAELLAHLLDLRVGCRKRA
jgi:hypothetical protein